MIKFIVTGSMRSGTTYLASLLNSQQNTFCLEQAPWRTFPKIFKNKEEFLCFSNNLDADFTYLGLPSPKISKIASESDNIIELYFDHLKSLFNCENIGFKRTMMAQNEISKMVRKGYKIILMKRDITEILASWINRINPNLDQSAYELQSFLKGINYYDLSLPKSSYKVVEFNDLLCSPDEVLDELSGFLNIKLKKVDILYHSFNKNRFPYRNNTSFQNSLPASMLSSLDSKYSNAQILACADLVRKGNYYPSIKLLAKNFMVNFYRKFLK